MTNSTPFDREDQDAVRGKDEQSEESGADGGPNRGPDVPAPFAPDSDEQSPFGDTDEHSDA